MIYALNEFCAWGGWRERGPAYGHNKSLVPLAKLNAEQQSLFSIHFFMQQYWHENPALFNAIVTAPAFNFGTLQITLRHADCWFWESRDPLRLNPWISEWGDDNDAWGHAISQANGLHTFILELETLTYKRDELDAMVQKAGSWEFRQEDGAVLMLDESAIKYSSWLGPRKYHESVRTPDTTISVIQRAWENRGKKCTCGWNKKEELHWCSTVSSQEDEDTGLDQEDFQAIAWAGNASVSEQSQQPGTNDGNSVVHPLPRKYPNGLPKSAIPKQVTNVKLLNWQPEGSSILDHMQEHVVAKLVWRKKVV